MYNKIRKPLLIVTIAVLVTFLVVSIWAAFSDLALLGRIANVIESTTLFVLVIQVVISAQQANKATEANHLALASLKVDDSRKSKEKAIEMANFFREEILNYTSLITRVYGEIGIKDLICSKQELFEDFDAAEVASIYGEDAMNTCEDKIHKICTKDLLLHIDINRRIRGEYFHPVKIGDPLSDARARSFFLSITSDVLNKLECFSMCFNYKIADEEVVYQSVHQVFLDTVKSLYIDIARLNVNSTDKYYTNIVSLYNAWIKRTRATKEYESQVDKKVRDIKNALPLKGKEHNLNC